MKLSCRRIGRFEIRNIICCMILRIKYIYIYIYIYQKEKNLSHYVIQHDEKSTLEISIFNKVERNNKVKKNLI